MLSVKDGISLIRLARHSIDNINNGDFKAKQFSEKRGVFVTLHSWPEKQLRGCIGFPEPVMPLKEAVIEAAKSAAYEDPRFEPIGEKEEYIVEVSVLTLPEEIKAKNPEEYIDAIEIGKHGLIAECDGKRGLLLPQVFPEWNADARKALEMTCEKAGLEKNAWKRKDCKILKFEAQIFIEDSPNGKVIGKNPCRILNLSLPKSKPFK